MKKDNLAAFIVPTGVGASIGGFAGDASPFASMISEVCTLMVNPNVVNGAVFSGINNKMFYTEGFAIDSFFKEEIALRPSRSNKIGVIFDCAIPENVLNVHINTMNAVEAVYGISTIGYERTKTPVGVDFSVLESGISSGLVKNPDTLMDAAQRLIDKGAEAIAVVCLFDDDDDLQYSNGSGVDPVGGVEAIISHVLTKEFLVPTAHAPAFESLDISTKVVDKRVSAEYITPTFLPCVLQGLYNAPLLVPLQNSKESDYTIQDLKALIMPANCLGGLPVPACVEKNIPIIAVNENKTVLNVTSENLGISDKVLQVDSYKEAKLALEKILNFI